MAKEEVIKRYKKEELNYRMDGRIEWMCPHGIGHTIYAPRVKQTSGTFFEDYVHGCDGCCVKRDKSKSSTEKLYVKAAKKILTDIKSGKEKIRPIRSSA